MANIKVIAEHSVDVDLLTGGICIDVGCRGFQFGEAMRDLGCKVVAFDLEEMKALEGITFIVAAVSDVVKQGFYVDTKDQQAKFLSDSGIPVRVTTLPVIYETMKEVEPGAQVDVLKLDIEGSEYLVLSDPNFQPIPRQISIEFHMHCHRALHDQYYEKCMENLLKYYVPVQHELTQAHGAGFNYWNSLFIRKDLV